MVNFETTNSDYRTVSILGQGWDGFVSVFLSKHLPSGKMVAIKRFNMDKLSVDSALVQQEIVLTRQLKHPNILQYHVSFVFQSEVYAVSPLMAFGSCKDLLNIHFTQGLPEPAIGLIIREVLEALHYIHKKGFIHRAIRASHVLISAKGHVCLSGLRYACPIIEHGRWQRQIHSFPGSTSRNLNWLGPEVLEQNLQGYNEKSDIYSIGVLLCELANGIEPFAGMPTTLMLIEKVRGAAPQLLDSTTIPKEEHSELQDDLDTYEGFTYNQATRRYTEGLHQITALCLQRESICRPSTSQLLSHSYLKSNRRGMLLPELLKPAIPLGDTIAPNADELADLETVHKMSDLELFTCEWDF